MAGIGHEGERKDMGGATTAMTRAAADKDTQALGRADLHLHTNLGDGTASPARVLELARRRGLDVIAVTDHDHLEGAKRVEELLAREADARTRGDLPPGRPIQLVWGCEVTTRDGHFLGLFMRKPPKMLQRAEATIEAIKEQGGLCVVPHPLGRLVPSLSRRRIDELLERGYPLDGIELYNPSPANAAARQRVRELNWQWGLAAVGSSDAHFWQHIGAGYTLFPGETTADLRRALEQKTTRDGGQEQPPQRLPLTAYVGQCFWSMVLDPPRKMSRRLRGVVSEAPDTLPVG